MLIDESNLKFFIAFSAIISVVVGAIINYFFNKSLKYREIELKIVEKLIDKRLKAYEDIISISKLFRITGDTKEMDKNGMTISYPSCMHTRDIFENFRVSFANVANQSSHWLNIDMFREINFVQDYLSNLDRCMNNKSEESFPTVAKIIKNDFMDIAADLERIANIFITDDLIKLKSIPTQGYHKYEIEYTKDRLSKTNLFKNIDIIDKIT